MDLRRAAEKYAARAKVPIELNPFSKNKYTINHTFQVKAKRKPPRKPVVVLNIMD